MGVKITIYLNDGLPKGVREVKIDQWSGKAVCGSRNRLKDLILGSEVSDVVCVYFLIGESEDGSLPNVYVGEADGFENRIKSHDSSKSWWQDVVVFYSYGDSLTKASVQYLESICLDRLKKSGKCIIKNGNSPVKPTVPKEDVSGLEAFCENIALIMPLLGFDIFVQSAEKVDTKLHHLFCHGKGIKAEGILLKDGKIKVLKGSEAVLENVKSFEAHPYRPLKDELIKMQRLIPNERMLIFSEDYVFDSPSAAAAIILARSSSGPATWKTKDGKLLREIFEKELG